MATGIFRSDKMSDVREVQAEAERRLTEAEAERQVTEAEAQRLFAILNRITSVWEMMKWIRRAELTSQQAQSVVENHRSNCSLFLLHAFAKMFPDISGLDDVRSIAAELTQGEPPAKLQCLEPASERQRSEAAPRLEPPGQPARYPHATPFKQGQLVRVLEEEKVGGWRVWNFGVVWGFQRNPDGTYNVIVCFYQDTPVEKKTRAPPKGPNAPPLGPQVLFTRNQNDTYCDEAGLMLEPISYTDVVFTWEEIRLNLSKKVEDVVSNPQN